MNLPKVLKFDKRRKGEPRREEENKGREKQERKDVQNTCALDT